ncbi:DUF2523 family protein [Comamonas sp. JNW]|uniref:DUF2523 family protein n=1 Tax=Comamonas sp. JNW TaxID=2170731 RepID=UPI000DE76992|nr:DUF2523 family protein [Comamonas sp. JNW]PWB18842.1 hypothetical protein DCO45_09705 [Comamonas sp. JNW]
MEGIIKAFDKILKWFSDVFVAIFTAAWDLLSDLFCWVLDALLGIAVTAANALDVSQLEGFANNMGEMPGEIVNIMQLAGLGTAAQIIGAAIGIRLLLQIIPFTRLGS